MRDNYGTITGNDAEVVAVGTGSRDYAAAFVKDEQVPFPVLVDDGAEAANAAAVKKSSVLGFLSADSRAGGKRASAAGHKIHKPGKRVTQLGATFVIGPGGELRYEHLDAHTADHAPLDEVLAALA